MHNETPPTDAITITNWYCERCERSGQVAHAPDAGVWEVFNLVFDNHRTNNCKDTEKVRVSKQPIESEAADAHTAD